MLLNEDLFEDGIDNTSLEDMFNYIKNYPIYKGDFNRTYFSRPCKIWDLDLTDEQKIKFDDFIQGDALAHFWDGNSEYTKGISQVGRMGGHLILSNKIADPEAFKYYDTLEEFENDHLAQYYDIEYNDGGDPIIDPEVIEENHDECAAFIESTYDAIVDFDNRVNILIDLLKQTLDERPLDELNDDSNFNESAGHDIAAGFIGKPSLEDAQAAVDSAIEKFGRVGGKLLSDLDDEGFYIDRYNKVQYKNKQSINEAIDESLLDKAYNGSYYTITGCGGDLQEWKDGYQELLNKEGIGTIKEWITFKGSDMNNKYHLTGGNAYPEDLTFLAFSLDGLEIGKLSLFKLKMQDRWFDDIVDNNIRRENKNESLNESQTRFSEINSDLSQEIFNVVLPKKITGDELVDYMYQFNDGLKAGMNKMELLVALKDAKSPDDFGRYIYNNSDPDKYRKIYNESKKLSESNVIGGEVEYIETYNDCKIYKLQSGEFSAAVSDWKLGSRNVSGESIEEVRQKIDKADKEYRQHFYNLPEAFNGGQTPGEFCLKMAQGFAKENPEVIKKIQNKEKTIEQTAEEVHNQFGLITKEMWEEIIKAACLCDTTPLKESYKVVDQDGNKVAQGGGFKSKEEAEMFAAQYGKEGLKVVKESFVGESDESTPTENGTNQFGDKEYKYKGYTICYFPYDVEYEDKTDHFEAYVIESPAVLSNGYHLPLHCEDENGEIVNFLSLEAAKKWIDVYDGEFKLEVKNGNEIHAVINSQEIKESFEDEHGVESISEEQPQVEIPAENPQNEDNGLVSIINNLIQDEFNTIQSYKDAIVNFANQDRNDLTQVLKDILDEENIHVGQLETLLKSLDSSAENIEQGKQEAEEQIEINKGDNI